MNARHNFDMSTTERPADLMTTLEAAALIHVHPNTIRTWIRGGQLPAWRFGLRSLRVSRADVLAMLRPVQVGDPPPVVPAWVDEQLRKVGARK